MRALITGVTGQDGSYLAELLLLKGYDVWGLVRRSASPNFWRINHLIKDTCFHIVPGDLTDLPSLVTALQEIQPDEVYNLAAQSYVGVSWVEPYHTIMVTGLGAINIFEAVKVTNGEAKIFQASSSEMFGNRKGGQAININDSMYARSPYGVAKIAAHQYARLCRDQGMFISCGISFNHESVRRNPEFVTRKITWEGSRVMRGEQEEVKLGNINAMRDWGYAPDYVYGFYKALQEDKPRDYIFATGETHNIIEILAIMEEKLGKDFKWSSCVSEMRPTDVSWLLGNYNIAEKYLGWKPKVTFKELVERMIEADLKRERADEMIDAWVMEGYGT